MRRRDRQRPSRADIGLCVDQEHLGQHGRAYHQRLVADCLHRLSDTARNNCLTLHISIGGIAMARTYGGGGGRRQLAEFIGAQRTPQSWILPAAESGKAAI